MCVKCYFPNKSLHFFFLITNQKRENPPAPAAAVDPVTMPAIAPPERPSFSGPSVGVVIVGVSFAMVI